MKQNLILFLIGIFVLSISCQNQKTKKDVVQKTESEGVTEKAAEIKTRLASLHDIKAVFEMADVGYYSEITNEPTKALSYEGDRKIAANMGVYMADMLYTMTTAGRSPDTYANYGAIMELSKNVGLTQEFPELIIERYEKTNVSIDTIVVMLEKAFSKSEKKLSDNAKSEFYAFMLLGNYIEKLHLISSIIERPKQADVPEVAVAELKRKLLLLMGRQSEPLKKLIMILSAYSEDASHVVELDEIRELVNRYNEVAAQREVIVKLESTEIFKAKEIVAIHEQISKIRNRIVN